MECKHCEYANLFDNKCLIDSRKLYDKDGELIQDCKNYKDGNWVAEMNCDKGSDYMDNKCKNCKHADIADNICCVTNIKLYHNGTEIVKNCSFFETNDVLTSFSGDEYDDFLNGLKVFIKNYIKQNKECNVVMNIGFDKRVELFWEKDKNDKF